MDENSDSDRKSLHDDSLLSITPPKEKKQKKAPLPKKTKAQPLKVIENDGVGYDGTNESPKPKKPSGATEKYQKVSDYGVSGWPAVRLLRPFYSSPNLSTFSRDLIPILARLSVPRSRCGYIIPRLMLWRCEK